MLSQVLFEEANRMVSDERKANSELTKENEALKKRLHIVLRTLGTSAKQTVVERRDSLGRWSSANLSFALATPKDSLSNL